MRVIFSVHDALLRLYHLNRHHRHHRLLYLPCSLLFLFPLSLLLPHHDTMISMRLVWKKRAVIHDRAMGKQDSDRGNEL